MRRDSDAPLANGMDEILVDRFSFVCKQSSRMT
jgi:hypothetical protein